jgi:putative spermidine/putrescine transport system permease protein
MPSAVAWTPGFGAVVAGFVFIALPLTILTFYPTLSRLNPELVEAATTMGASPATSFLTVVVPVTKQAIAGTFTLVFIFVLGSYLVPQVLGRPAQWTLPVHITDQAVLKSNLPLAAALAMILLLASALLSLAALRLGQRRTLS